MRLIWALLSGILPMSTDLDTTKVSIFKGTRMTIELVGKWFQMTGRRNEIFICTKVGFRLDSKTGGICGTPEYIQKAGEDSLKRLQVTQIDMLFLHRHRIPNLRKLIIEPIRMFRLNILSGPWQS